jgi:hypothetical protein
MLPAPSADTTGTRAAVEPCHRPVQQAVDGVINATGVPVLIDPSAMRARICTVTVTLGPWPVIAAAAAVSIDVKPL